MRNAASIFCSRSLSAQLSVQRYVYVCSLYVYVCVGGNLRNTAAVHVGHLYPNRTPRPWHAVVGVYHKCFELLKCSSKASAVSPSSAVSVCVCVYIRLPSTWLAADNSNNNNARNLMPTAKIMKVFALLSTKICQSKFHFIFFAVLPLHFLSAVSRCFYPFTARVYTYSWLCVCVRECECACVCNGV